MKAITRFYADESGATAIEYGLLASLIAVVRANLNALLA
jgi:Flp pilus assembly pilin Flp